MSVAEAPRRLSPSEIRERLEHDTPYYARHCLKIVPAQGTDLAPLEPKFAQLKLDAALERQRLEGLPQRAIVLKARKEGVSTWSAAKGVQRFTQQRNHKALVVAHDLKTSGELFAMAEMMYANLPNKVVDGLVLKPPVASGRRAQEIRLGEKARHKRLAGEMGINSTYLVDTANEFDAGRGFTYHTLHISEVGFFMQAERKLNALLNTVNDEPGTMIVLESTANGYNRFRRLWISALEGEGDPYGSDYAAVFIAWFEDPSYVRRFKTEEIREEFIRSIGTGPWGDEEPNLVEEYGLIPEQLAWRRWCIVNRCQADLRKFAQEYPANWQEAFIATGKQVFSPVLVSKVVARTEKTDPAAEIGVIQHKRLEKRTLRNKEIEVPVDPIWVPEAEANASIGEKLWRRWEAPEPGHQGEVPTDLDRAREPDAFEEARRAALVPRGQYVCFVDSASGRETISGDPDFFVVCLINLLTGTQVAEWRDRNIDPDVVADKAVLACRLYNDAWLAIETTGGYGLSIAHKARDEHRYPFLFRRKMPKHPGVDKSERVLGWDTNSQTKPLMVDHGRRVLREGTDGIHSRHVARELQTYIRDEKGAYGPEEDEHDDALMAWLGAKFVALHVPRRLDPATKKRRPAATTSTLDRPWLRQRQRPARG